VRKLVCGKCKEAKSEDLFARASRRKTGRQYACKACNAQYREDNREQIRSTVRDWYDRVGWHKRLERAYGVPAGWYGKQLAVQHGTCAICWEPPAEGGRLHVDHDRSCCNFDARPDRPTCGKCTRGLLCPPCNVGLGIVERPDWMVRVEEYLRIGVRP
jgi:hypothetical protein